MLVHSYPKRPPTFKRHHTQPDPLNLRPSPSPPINREGLRPSEDGNSLYSHASSSTPSVLLPASPIRPLPSPPALAITTDWPPTRSTSPLETMSHRSNSTDLASSPPDTPIDELETELRKRRQLSKAARVLGENVPLDLVFQPKHSNNPLLRVFPEPPPRRSTESPLPGQLPREILTERPSSARARHPAKIARRASLSLASFASKLRGGSNNAHSRGSSQESQAQSTLSVSSSGSSTGDSSPTLTRNAVRNTLTSPIVFAFPRNIQAERQFSGDWPPPSASPVPTLEFDDGALEDLVIDIRRSPVDLDCDEEDETVDTPIVEFPTPRNSRRLHHYSSSEVLQPTPKIVPMPSHGHSPSEIVSPSTTRRPTTPFARAETPFSDYQSRPQTPFIDYIRPTTPFEDRAPARPTTPFYDLDSANSNEYLSPVVSRRRDQGWSGEWNQRDMADVIQKLRALR
ncbi:hypothetical protein MIND_00947300 [Mycena indigotica]|uniref:Uncharacterized protein n=1 Tax=Mycena indigotica TaxID=2126181 RepID=A0A8H6SDV7_9AGAR|nr:uncharacterized protein MIND_00947300 [Mycena indigotica]KAF7297143.1 hypothetical protein MIND_00947300 [Mycena indigotica]